jgi:transcription initiation factor TFIIIB Brf1 subunit/transcription initiation factor TFIIB
MIRKTEYIYERAKEVGLVRGRGTYELLAAAAYIACKQSGVAKTMTDFTSIRCDITSKKGFICNKVNKALKVSVYFVIDF